jgi:hypothetical protein
MRRASAIVSKAMYHLTERKQQLLGFPNACCKFVQPSWHTHSTAHSSACRRTLLQAYPALTVGHVPLKVVHQPQQQRHVTCGVVVYVGDVH